MVGYTKVKQKTLTCFRFKQINITVKQCPTILPSLAQNVPIRLIHTDFKLS